MSLYWFTEHKVHSVEALEELYVPAWQARQFAREPDMGEENVPGKQTWHALSLVIPKPVWYFPAEQLRQKL